MEPVFQAIIIVVIAAAAAATVYKTVPGMSLLLSIAAALLALLLCIGLLEPLAAALGEEAVTLEDLCEPYLMQMGFLTRTPRGRCATRLAYEHLGMKAPETGSAEENGQQSLF